MSIIISFTTIVGTVFVVDGRYSKAGITTKRRRECLKKSSPVIMIKVPGKPVSTGEEICVVPGKGSTIGRGTT